MKRLLILVIILSSIVSQASNQCVNLFPVKAESLGQELRLVNAENGMRVFDEVAHHLLSNVETAANGRREETKDAAKATIKAAFQGRWSSHVHKGLIEKRARDLIDKMDLLYNPDKLGTQNEQIQHVIRQARISLVAIGIKRYAEMNGLIVVDHWSFKSFAAARMTLWHDILKPAIKLFLMASIPRYKIFSEDEAMDILWNGVYSPSSIIWNNAYKQSLFMKVWTWWSNVSPKVVIGALSTGVVVAVIFGSGMTYKSYLNQHADSLARAVEQTISLQSLQAAMKADIGPSIYYGTLEKYREKHGKEPSAEFKAETKKKVLKIWPDSEIED